MTTTDPEDVMITRITAAVTDGRAGNRARARDTLTALWDELGDTGDPLHRCVLAHYLADLTDAAEDALRWDTRALVATEDLTDDRARRRHPSLTVAGFLPSLHLNLADDHRRLGDVERARHHLTLARERLADLPEGPYADGILAGLDHVAGALEAGSTDRLDTHP